MAKSSSPLDFTLAAAGDFLGSLRISCYEDEDYLAMIRIIRDADAAYANLETVLHNFEGYPAAETGGTYMWAPPSMADDLKWAGFDMVSCATNHICDYSYEGMFSTMRTLERAGILHAGIGANLGEAREPKYLQTAKGRIALISVCSTFPGWSRAGNARKDMQGRPGLNPLRYYYIIDSKTMKELQNICSKLQLWSAAFRGGQEIDIFRAGLDPTRWKFVVGDVQGVSTKCNEQDLRGNIASIKNARKQADYVLVAYHGHEFFQNHETPSQFQIEFAHACIDEGADVFLGNGTHLMRGIEIYKGKPIFHGLSTLVSHTRYIPKFPADAYERVGLGPEATPMDYLETRYRLHADEGYKMYAGGTGSETKGRKRESVIALCSFNKEKITELRLYPIRLADYPSRQKPFSVITGDDAKIIINDLAALSSPYGTTIDCRDGIGVIQL